MIKAHDEQMAESRPTLDYASSKPLPSQDPEFGELLPVILAVAAVFVLAILMTIFAAWSSITPGTLP